MKTSWKLWIYVNALLASVLLVSAGDAWAQGMSRDPGAAVLQGAPTATWISEGKSSAPLIYVFFDPNCAGCHFLYESLRSFVRRGKVRVRWIPVAIVDTTSMGKAAAILQAPKPIAALAYNEKNFKPEDGGISEDIPSTTTHHQLLANGALLNKLPIGVVPTMVFDDAAGHTTVIQGALTPLALRRLFMHLP